MERNFLDQLNLTEIEVDLILRALDSVTVIGLDAMRAVLVLAAKLERIKAQFEACPPPPSASPAAREGCDGHAERQ
jgi:hypothetical protein